MFFHFQVLQRLRATHDLDKSPQFDISPQAEILCHLVHECTWEKPDGPETTWDPSALLTTSWRESLSGRPAPLILLLLLMLTEIKDLKLWVLSVSQCPSITATSNPGQQVMLTVLRVFGQQGAFATASHHLKHHFIHDFIHEPPANEPDPETPIGPDLGQVCPLGHDATVQNIPAHCMCCEMWGIILFVCCLYCVHGAPSTLCVRVFVQLIASMLVNVQEQM